MNHSREISELFRSFWTDEISEDVFTEKLESIFGSTPDKLRAYLGFSIREKRTEDLEYILQIISHFGWEAHFMDEFHQLLIATWHAFYEDIIHILQAQKNPQSIPFIKKAIQLKFPALESYGTGTRQFISQCGHALWDIGTPEAILIIRTLAEADDPVLQDEMLYRISRIEGRNDYQRNFDLE